MANYTLKLSDSVTTIDFYSGKSSPITPGYIVAEGGLDLPPPAINPMFNQSNQSDGAPMSRAVYGNRTITVTFDLIGSSLSDVQTKIRAIQSCLNDAAYRYLLGEGNLYYLETQWGVTAGASTYFDVLRGDLHLPSDALNSMKLTSSFVILGCKLVLTCLPFGRGANVTIGTVSLQNSQGNLAVMNSFEGRSLTGATSLDNGGYAVARTFVAAVTAPVTYAAMWFSKNAGANLGNVYYELYAVDANHKPTGSVLATTNVSSSTIPSPAYTIGANWLFANFVSPYTVILGTEYALIARIPNWVSGGLLVEYTTGGSNYSWSTTAWASPPQGATWTATAGSGFYYFAVLYAVTDVNYQDVNSPTGDVPTGSLLKFSTLPDSANFWIGKISGGRQTSALWFPSTSFAGSSLYQGVYAGFIPALNEGGYAGSLVGSALSWYAASASVGMVSFIEFATNAGNYQILTGKFKVLVRCRVTDKTKMGFALGGRNYNSRTIVVPASSDVVSPAANNTWQILDLGNIILPAIGSKSDILSHNLWYFQIYNWCTATISGASYWDVAWIQLLPIDEGYVIGNSGTNAPIIAIDTLSKIPNIYGIDTYLASYIGAIIPSGGPLPQIGRESTRIYFVMDNNTAISSDIIYQPRFITI